jgi:hypothetical protein
MKSINGVSRYSNVYTTRVSVDAEGEYKIGPAFIDDNGQHIESESVTIKSTNNPVETKKVEDCFLTMDTSKRSVYVGERVGFMLRFYQSNTQIRLDGIDKPSFKGFLSDPLMGSQNGTSILDEVKYRYSEWRSELYPEGPGVATIPPVRATYITPLERRSRRDDLFDLMGGLFGSSHEKKELYSNTVTIDVKPLPYHESETKVVGHFEKYISSTNSSSAGAGEAIVLTLSLGGSGNFKMIDHPKLTLPDGLNYYNSHAKMKQDQQTGMIYKSFEYVIQGLEVGEYTLPSQEFIYFDLESEEYKTVESEPVDITISAISQSTKLEEQEGQGRGDTFELFPIDTGGLWKAPRKRMIPWLYFFMLLFSPLVAWIIFYIKKQRNFILAKNAPEIRYRKAFKYAYEIFKKARTNNYQGQLYHMFIELFGARLKIMNNQVSEALIEKTLQEKGFSSERITEWRLLFARLAEQAFTSHRVGDNNDNLFNKAFSWLRDLEKVL